MNIKKHDIVGYDDYGRMTIERTLGTAVKISEMYLECLWNMIDPNLLAGCLRDFVGLESVLL
jgi:hypothetical protein